MTGKAPETLALTKLIYGFPESWQEQREAFGMAESPITVIPVWYLLSIASGFFYLQKSIYCENSILCCIVRYSDQCKKLKKVALYILFSISMVYKKCNAEGNYLLVPQRTERKRDFGRFYGVISRTQRIWQSCKSL